MRTTKCNNLALSFLDLLTLKFLVNKLVIGIMNNYYKVMLLINEMSNFERTCLKVQDRDFQIRKFSVLNRLFDLLHGILYSSIFNSIFIFQK